MKKEEEALPEVTQRDWQIYLTTVGLLFVSCFVWPVITDTPDGYPWSVAIIVLAVRAMVVTGLIVWMKKKNFTPEKKEDLVYYWPMLFFSFIIADKCILGVMEGVSLSSAYRLYALGVSSFVMIHCALVDKMTRGRAVYAVEAIVFAAGALASVSLHTLIDASQDTKSWIIVIALFVLSIIMICVSLLKLRRYLRMAPTSGLNRGSYTPTRLPRRIG